ncbi:hypothetical protein SmJEL517_g03004 [Synchytrium microbalum]|uniref:Double-strand break repair protein n=1 Tax=Synchytrium microbalum TaxID=1806994 RepID=A0A507C8P7_9FUNG|nr:uncharacterized protein SmJEL517_g03004 [Synchytrium microbalum]TPX34366.1 hypothetical protein SmJEL517_g03004 [Synchytrium microbalum]
MSEGAAPSSQDDALKDTFRILLATDNHIGFEEKDPIRGRDSLLAFEEILKIAQEKSVDLILLGGDLFHEARPSRQMMFETMGLMKQFCMGNRPVSFELLSDEKEMLGSKYVHEANYMSPNVNISIPIFTIHGNHDDPGGDGLCACDLLAVNSLVNYFGKQDVVENIQVTPLQLKKGDTYLALFGMGHIRDERLHRAFALNKVTMMRPIDHKDDYFNLMILHQNRAKHAAKNYIPENFIDDWIHLVMWGHEHECLIEPVGSATGDFQIIQPGSSVATSLAIGEEKPKHVGILHVRGKDFEIEPIRLKSVRPFVMEEIVLADEPELKGTVSNHAYDDNKVVKVEKMVEFLRKKVDNLIAKAKRDWLELNPDKEEEDVPLPLIRLKVEYSGGFESYSGARFGGLYAGKVANPSDILLFHRARSTFDSVGTARARSKKQEPTVPLLPKEAVLKVEDVVLEHLQTQKMTELPENLVIKAVGEYVNKGDNDAFKDFFKKTINYTVKKIKDNQEAVGFDNAAFLNMVEQARKDKYDEEDPDKSPARPRQAKRKHQSNDTDEDDDEQDDDNNDQQRRGRNDDDDEQDDGPTLQRRKKRTSTPTVDKMDVDGSDEPEDDFLVDGDATRRKANPGASGSSTRGRGRGRGGKAGTSRVGGTAAAKRRKRKDDSEEDTDIDDEFDMKQEDEEEADETPKPPRGSRASSATTTKKPAATKATKTRQSTLSFAPSQAPIMIDDDDEDFEDDPDRIPSTAASTNTSTTASSKAKGKGKAAPSSSVKSSTSSKKPPPPAPPSSGRLAFLKGR